MRSHKIRGSGDENAFNVFCLPLMVGHSSGVSPKRKKGTKKNETAQPAGTVHEKQQEISGL